MKPRRAILRIVMLLVFVVVFASAANDVKPKRSEHWSLQPISHPQIPRGQFSNPIDAFIAAGLSEKGLKMSAPADRTTLIRRVTFDLLGLPPTPPEIDAFVTNRSPRAYEELVERLLASPRYGERWGRRWLDVARYTESQGFEYDRLRPNAWQYRDYVIKSFNDDKPYDQFMKEQIAGDVLKPVTTDSLLGVSFLVCGPWDQAGNSQANVTQKATTREEELEDLIAVVGQSFLGLTINCARCHTHKFDPIPHEEYYRIKSVFEGVRHGERPIATEAQIKSRAREAAALAKQLAAAQAEVWRVDSEIAELDRAQPSADQLALRETALASAKKIQSALDALKPFPVSYIGAPVQPEPTRRLKRGDVSSPQEIVSPGALSAIADLNADLNLSPDAPEAQRRIKFAEWLADPRNPLPPRVMANRIWQSHFGQGLVATPSDFGVMGAKPTHPELLDYLASELIANHWSVKHLHRLILNSDAYRQQSGFDAKAAAIDADAQFLWRFPPRRIEAEELRDAMLTASGEINFQLGGPSFRPFTIANFNSDFYEIKDMLGADFNRRTVYRINVNSGKDPLLDAFDCPDPSVKTPRRGVTTTPLQALALMNNSFVQRQAAKLAERALRESNNDLPRAINIAYQRAVGRPADKSDMKLALRAAKERGLFNVCWALLNSTEFVYVR
jgi:hypothetical protein